MNSIFLQSICSFICDDYIRFLQYVKRFPRGFFGSLPQGKLTDYRRMVKLYHAAFSSGQEKVIWIIIRFSVSVERRTVAQENTGKNLKKEGETRMAQNIVVSIFKVESEGFQALAELRQNPGSDASYISAAALVKKENETLKMLDGFDTGANTKNDTVAGGLVGALFGILGGPIGILLGGTYGALIGSAFDSSDAMLNASMLEQICGKLVDGEVALIGLVFEADESILDRKLSGYDAIIARFDAAAVAEEVDEAELMAKEMAKQARRELRDEKKETRKAKKEEKKARLSADWEGFKAKFKKDTEA